VPSLFRHFSAPIKLRYDYSDDELAFLLAHDNDDFNRWDAGQLLQTRALMAMVEALQQGREASASSVLFDAMGHLLEQAERNDPALLAEALMLPDEGFLGEQMDVIDVDAIHAARAALRREIARRFASLWEGIYRASATEGGYSLDPASMGRRRLKNLALAYLLAGDAEQYSSLALEQFEGADNMTDSIAVLQALRDTDVPARIQVFDAFHDRWQDDPLVLDKWFAIQATAARPDVLDEVKRLMEHPGFMLKNPNRVRALVGGYMQANPVGFHRADGAGYAFAAETIIALDALNPQVASRLAKVFSRWRRYDSNRQRLMHDALEHIAAREGLSPDVYEVVSNSLNAEA